MMLKPVLGSTRPKRSLSGTSFVTMTSDVRCLYCVSIFSFLRHEYLRFHRPHELPPVLAAETSLLPILAWVRSS